MSCLFVCRGQYLYKILKGCCKKKFSCDNWKCIFTNFMNLCYNQQKIILESKNNPLFSKNNECTFLKKGFKITIITERGTKIAKAQWLLGHRVFICFLEEILNKRKIFL